MNLKKGIEDSGLQKKFIAKKIGISQQYFSMMLNGKIDMPEEVSRKVLKLVRQANRIAL